MKATKKSAPTQDKMNLVIGMLAFIIIVQLINFTSQLTQNNQPLDNEYSQVSPIDSGTAAASTAVQSTTRNDGNNPIVKKTTTVNTGLVINEIKYTDLKQSTTTKTGTTKFGDNDKFIELLNTNKTDSITLTDGWTLVLSYAPYGLSWQYSVAIMSDSGPQTIKPGAYYTVCFTGKNYAKKCDQYIPAKYSDYLPHDFEIWIAAPDNTVPDFVQRNNSNWPDKTTDPTNLSLQLINPVYDNSDGISWCMLPSTPGSMNAPCPDKQTNLVINEFHYTVNPGDPTDHRYIELYNNSDQTITLTEQSGKKQYYLTTYPQNKYPLGTGVIKPHGFWLMCDGADSVLGKACDRKINKPPYLEELSDYKYLLSFTDSIDNTGSSVFDKVDHTYPAYFDNNWPDAGNGKGPFGSNYSMSLKDPSSDNNNGINWCKAIPSPGVENTKCAP